MNRHISSGLSYGQRLEMVQSLTEALESSDFTATEHVSLIKCTICIIYSSERNIEVCLKRVCLL